MLKNLIRGGARALFAILALVAATVPSRAADAPLVVGFVYVSPIGEAGWTYQHELGRRALERALGPRVKTVFVEAVAEGPDSERVMRDLVAAQGAKLVFATSFGYLDPALRVAAEFPAAKFEHGADYLVLHPRAHNVVADPGPEWPDVTHCLPAIEQALGSPAYRDDQIVVYRLAGLSPLGNNRRPVQQ